MDGALVRSGAERTSTDERGAAFLRLRAGHRALGISRTGFRADTLRVEVQADTTLEAILTEQAVEIEAVMVVTTRSQRRVHDEPERVEVMADEDVDEKSQMHPGDLGTLLKEIAGVQMQTTSPASGAMGIRLQGLRSQYTDVLSDGLPLLGDDTSGIGLLQSPPLDLGGVEVIKGAASALYGPAALGGVVNLISRRPPEGRAERALLLNQTSRGGSDVALWLAEHPGEHQGFTLLAGAHRQPITDVNGDHWADLPGFDRAEIRPRWFWNGEGGRSLLGTMSFMSEDRTGGRTDAALRATGFREGIDTRRVDAGLVVQLPAGTASMINLRASATGSWQRHVGRDSLSGAEPYRDLRSSGFAEATWTRVHPHALWLLGGAWQEDFYRNDDLPGLDQDAAVRSAFAHTTVTRSTWLAASATGRVDADSRVGTFFSPRLSLLTRAGKVFEARFSVGSGFHTPGLFTDETAAIQLPRLVPPARLSAERARSIAVDLTARRGPVEVNGTLFASQLDHPVRLSEPAGADSEVGASVAMVKAPGPARQRGFELLAAYQREPVVVTLTWAWIGATESEARSLSRRDVPLTPHQTVGCDFAWEEDESGTRIGFEVFFTGRQSLENDPTRTVGAAFAEVGVLFSQRIGRAVAFVNGENLTDVRQSRYEPVLLPRPGPGGRLTVDAWAPAEGRMVNAGVRIGF